MVPVRCSKTATPLTRLQDNFQLSTRKDPVVVDVVVVCHKLSVARFLSAATRDLIHADDLNMV